MSREGIMIGNGVHAWRGGVGWKKNLGWRQKRNRDVVTLVEGEELSATIQGSALRL